MHRPRARSFGLSILILAGLSVLAITLPQACAQNVNGRYDNFAWTATTIAGQQTFTSVPYASVQVCNYPANAVPCTNLVTLYLGPTATGGTAPNPTPSDLYGNFGFWAPAGTYQYTLTTSTGQSVGPYSVVLGSGSGGGGGSPGGALYSIQYNNSVFAGASISGLVKASTTGIPVAATPNSDYLLPTGPGTGLTGIPYLTANTFTGNQTAPQFIAGTSITTPAITISGFSSSVGNCVQVGTGGLLTTASSACGSGSGGATTPATANLLKGNGAVNGVLAAVPNTDYTTPSGSISGTAGNLSGTPTLPNGVSGTTQTATDTSTLLATDSFVHTVAASQAAVSIPSTANLLKGAGSAGSALASLFTDNATTGGYTGTGGFSAKSFNSTDTVNNTSVSFQTGSGGDSTCPTPVSGTSFICTKSSGISVSINGGAYAAIGSGGGTPGGSNTDVQVNSSGSLAGYAGFTYNNSTQTMTVGPLGTANSGANFNSGISQLCDSYWTGTAAAPGCWSFQATPLSGTNPYDILTVGYTGSPTSGQINFPYSRFNVGFELNADNGAGQVVFKGPPNMAIPSYNIHWPAAAPLSGNTFFSCTPTDSTNCTASWVSGGGSSGGIAVTPQQFSGFGDAFSPPDGFNTTASSTTVVFTDASLISTSVDGGKDIWIRGAGASGVAFHSTIVTVTDSSHAIVAAAPSATLSNALGVYGHDDTTPINSCIKYSSVNAVQCWLVPQPAPIGQSGIVGFLVGQGSLVLTSNNNLEENSGPSLVGNSQSNGTNLFCEFNGDCLNLASGPIQGANVSNVAFEEDPTQPASRGIHLNPQPGTFTNGPFTNSNFLNVNVDNPALECLWSDGGGGSGYAFNLPVQFVQFTQFWCSGPNQSHPANLILMTGQHAQIIFINGQVNGQGWNGSSAPLYPNPLVLINDQGPTAGIAPVDVKFFGYTIEVGTQGLYVASGAANNIHYDNGYIENVSSPFSVNAAVANTFNGNHIANSGNIGAVFQFSGGAGASVRDTLEYGGVAVPSLFASCTGSNQIDFANNNNVSHAPTSGCATTTTSTGSTTLTVTNGTTVEVTSAVGGAIQTITAPSVASGKTLTVYATAGMQFATGGNITLGNYASPVTIPSGGTATFTLMDTGATWLLTDAPPPSITSVPWANVVHGTNTDTSAFSTNGAWSFHQGGVYFDSSTGGVVTQYGPGSTPGSSSTCVYDDGNFNFNATCNGNRGLFFKANFGGQFIAGFQRDGSTTNVFKVGLDGSLISTGSLTLATARKGTFTCTAAGTITIANALEQLSSDVVISLNSQSGTISTPPAMKTVTAGTGFTVLCGVADTSVYNYDILN